VQARRRHFDLNAAIAAALGGFMPRVLKPIALCLALAAAFLAGTSFNPSSPQAGSGDTRKVLYWHDPMHPEYKSDKPGTAPDCGMALEPVYADGRGNAPAPGSRPPNSIRVAPEKQQLLGVRVGEAEQSPGLETVRTVGRVAPDDERIYRINTSASGWIRRAYSNTVGSLVRNGEPLATLFTRELLSAQQAYFYALDALDRFTAAEARESQLASTRAQVQSAIESLQSLGMGDVQIAELGKSREVTREIVLRSPTTGFVLERNISPGERFESGEELYVIADLRKVWVLADVFQYEAKFIRPGQKVRVVLPPDEQVFAGAVSEVLPQFDPSTRTLKIRIEVDNAGYGLRPGMFVDVYFPLNLPSALTVPSEAILDTGLRKVVFVDLGDGYFEPRRVDTGWRMGDRVQILRGLMPGERVVTSGNFLLSSESRLKAAAAGVRSEPEADVMCGMEVDPLRARAEGRVSTVRKTTYYFCSHSCKKRFDEDPGPHTR
jgi:RND family efflux transporter MFP subunit